MPAMDVCEDDQSFTVRADVPGLKPSAVKLTVEKNTLCISGERPSSDMMESEAKKGVSWYRAERPHGAFRRCVTLPVHIDAAKVHASQADGVLTISLPKVAPAATAVKEIAIQSAL